MLSDARLHDWGFLVLDLFYRIMLSVYRTSLKLLVFVWSEIFTQSLNKCVRPRNTRTEMYAGRDAASRVAPWSVT